MTAWVVDRRENPKGKSIINSQRFINKAKIWIKKSVDDTVKNGGKIENMGGDGSGTVTISKNQLHEPTFHFDRKYGDFDFVLPGNKDTTLEFSAYIEKDEISKRPDPGPGGAKNGSPDGDGFDEFSFDLSNEQWAEILFADMELPNLEEKNISDVEQIAWKKAGFKTDGSPANISIRRTLRNSFGRRTALHRPKTETMEELEEKFFNLDTPEEEKEIIRLKLEAFKNKLKAIPYIDTMDVRYYNLEPVPKPIYNAVMYALMDCSASMSQDHKDLAKRFYILLYRFLKTKYQKVEVVFIRHTHEAKIVDEEEFFYGRETGGTVVSTAFEKMMEDIKNIHSPDQWNIYVAQTSDGDNWEDENSKLMRVIVDEVMPIIKYMVYLEVAPTNIQSWHRSDYASEMWKLYEEYVKERFQEHFNMKKATKREDIFPAFAELFAKRS